MNIHDFAAKWKETFPSIEANAHAIAPTYREGDRGLSGFFFTESEFYLTACYPIVVLNREIAAQRIEDYKRDIERLRSHLRYQEDRAAILQDWADTFLRKEDAVNE